MMKKLLVLLVVAALATVSLAEIVNVDFTTNDTTGPTGNNLAGVIGKSSPTWNAVGDDLLHTDLVNEDGNPTAIDFQLTGTMGDKNTVDRFAIEAGGTSTGFFFSYAFLHASSDPGSYDISSFTISGLNPGLSYNIVLYATWNWVDAGSEFRLSEDGGSSWSAWELVDGVPSEATAAFSEGHNYVVFEDVVPDANGEILGEWQTTLGGGSIRHRGMFNALQIESSGGATNPDPADGATGISISTDLQWDAAKDPTTALRRTDIVSHYLYMVEREIGQDPNWLFAVTSTITDPGSDPVTALNASLPLALATNKQYYWKVEEGLDSGGGVAYGIGDPNNIPGPTWTFDTSTLPDITTLPVDTAVFELDDPSFVAVIGSQVPLSSVIWSKDGVELTGEGTVTDNGDDTFTAELVITDAVVADEGDYTISVTSVGGTSDTTASPAALLIKRQVAHWKFDGDYTDDLGNFDLDNSDPNRYPNFTTGLLSAGQAIDPNGSGQFVDVTPAEPLNYFAGYTFTVWTQTDNTTQNYTGIVASGSGGFQIDVLNSNFRYAAQGSAAVNFGPVTAGQRTFLAVSFDGSEAMLYMDGLAVGSPISQNASLQILNKIQVAVNRGNNIYYDGIIDDVQMYNYALSQADIVDIQYAETTAPICDLALANMFDVAGPGGDTPDCLVDLYDFAAFAAEWLDCVILPVLECP